MGLFKRRDAPKPLSSEERWDKEYGGARETREFFSKPYVLALAPVIAAAIEHSMSQKGGKANLVRLLTVGAGEGKFSSKMLPAVRQLLEERGLSPKLEVMESDISPSAIRESVSDKKLAADVRQLPFRPESVDIILGENMIDFGGDPEVGSSLEEISRVLAPRGVFLHLQDFFPQPGKWARSANGRMLKAHLHFESAQQRDQILELGREAHLAVSGSILENAKRLGMEMEPISLKAVVRTNEKLPETLNGKPVHDYNHLVFDKGYVYFGKSSEIPTGRKQIEYSGIVSVVSKGRELGQIKKRMQEWMNH